MNHANVHLEMLINVAVELGSELCQKMVFVGGRTTSLLLTDEFTKEQVRHTDDVDLIIHVLGLPPYYKLQEELRSRNFKKYTVFSKPTFWLTKNGKVICKVFVCN